MRAADAVLLVANLVYGTSYVAARVALDGFPPATLALVRLALGAAVLVPLAWRRAPGPPAPGDRAKIFWMGVLGFAAAFAFGHWGIALSTATNAALLIGVEPVALILLSPLLLGERLSRREAVGAALVVAGGALVVLNGIPGVTRALLPHWRGDLLLVLSAIAYASYSLFGRDVLRRRDAAVVTAQSIVWGLVSMVPFAAAEIGRSGWPVPGRASVVAAIYLALAVTAFGYGAWNWGLQRVPAPRAAIFINVQPVVGAALGVAVLGEPATAFTAAGAILVVGGLYLTVRSG